MVDTLKTGAYISKFQIILISLFFVASSTFPIRILEIKRENGYFMYHKINVPGILIESGFITNSNDRYKLKDSNYQAILARNIVLGVINYFSK